MLIHLTPKINVGRLPAMTDIVQIVDFESPELGLSLKVERDLVARRPYPNKSWLVACRKQGRKAVNGILVETPAPIREFTTVTRWAVGSDKVLTHYVRYVVTDEELGAISEDMLTWGDRRPQDYPVEGSPLQVQPCMEIVPGIDRVGDVTDRLSGINSPQGPDWIVERSEVFLLPTIDYHRLESGDHPYSFASRLPERSQAFQSMKLNEATM